MKRRFLSVVLILAMALTLTCLSTNNVAAYYGGYGGLYGGYGGIYGGLGLYGGLMGGLYGGYGGLYGGYGGLYGSSLYSPFGLQNMYYTIDTGTGLNYQVPFMQIAPLLGVGGLYNSLFPSLFNPTSSFTAPATTVLPVEVIT